MKRASFKKCDHKQTLGGKGDVRRPEDETAFEDGWDRIFGTYMYMERENLVYGVDVFPDEVKNGQVMDLLKQPFQQYQKPTIIPEKD